MYDHVFYSAHTFITSAKLVTTWFVKSFLSIFESPSFQVDFFVLYLI